MIAEYLINCKLEELWQPKEPWTTTHPEHAINYFRNRAQAEEFLIFAGAVANKEASMQSAKLGQFYGVLKHHEYNKRLASIPKHLSTTARTIHTIRHARAVESMSPFELIKSAHDDHLEHAMHTAKLGCYADRHKMFRGSSTSPPITDIGDPRKASIADLERVHGIAMKSSRFYKIGTDPEPGAIAAIDTHNLKGAHAAGLPVDLDKKGKPKRPATRKKYLALQKAIVDYGASVGLPHPRDLDQHWFLKYRDKRNPKTPTQWALKQWISK